MASAVFFLDLKGKVCDGNRMNSCLTEVLQTLLARNYRGDIPMSAVEKFPVLLSEAEEESSAVAPCFSDEGINVGCLGPYDRAPKVCVSHTNSVYIVPLHKTQQPLPPRTHETQHKCRRNPPIPTQDRRGLHRILQRARRRKHPRQFRHHLRTTRRNDGLWLPPNH